MQTRNLPISDETDIRHDPAEVNIVPFSEQPVLTEGSETIITTRKDSTEQAGFKDGCEVVDNTGRPLGETMTTIPNDIQSTEHTPGAGELILN
jgi:hypothetical protein